MISKISTYLRKRLARKTKLIYAAFLNAMSEFLVRFDDNNILVKV